MGAPVARADPRRDRAIGGVLILIDVHVPYEQEGTKAVVRAWLKKIGDAVEENDPLVELETDKVTQEVSSPASGVLAEILLDSDAEAIPGALLARIETDPAAVALQKPKAETAPGAPLFSAAIPARAASSPAASFEKEQETRLSPSVRRALQQHGLDPSRVEGTGRNGRITREDVDRCLSGAQIARTEPSRAAPGKFAANDIAHDRMRLTIAENMSRALAEQPHVTAVFEADFSAVSAHKAGLAAKGVKLSYTAYIVKAAAEAMAVAPAINGRWKSDCIAISPTIDIGVGTALGDKGLVVPVVRDVAALSLEEIGTSLDELTRRAREGKLERSQVSGGSFTISNHGVSGSLLASPIILHQGQAAILGIGKLQKRLVVKEIGGVDAILVRPMAYVTLTIDHRVVDGFQTNAWLSRFVEIIENWPQQ